MNKTFRYVGLFECPLFEALSLLQRTASIQIPLTRPTLSLFEKHGRGGCLWSCHIRFLLLHVFTTMPCFRQSFYCSKYFLNILHTFPGLSCLHVDLTLFANCAICWEPVHRHSLQTMSLLKWHHYNHCGQACYCPFYADGYCCGWKLALGTHSQRVFSSFDFLYFSKCQSDGGLSANTVSG